MKIVYVPSNLSLGVINIQAASPRKSESLRSFIEREQREQWVDRGHHAEMF